MSCWQETAPSTTPHSPNYQLYFLARVLGDAPCTEYLLALSPDEWKAASTPDWLGLPLRASTSLRFQAAHRPGGSKQKGTLRPLEVMPCLPRGFLEAAKLLYRITARMITRILSYPELLHHNKDCSFRSYKPLPLVFHSHVPLNL